MGAAGNLLFYIKSTFKVRGIRAEIRKRSQQESTNKTSKKVLFCPVNSSMLFMGRESVIAEKCKTLGADVEFLQYDLPLSGNPVLPGSTIPKLKMYYRIGRFFYRMNKLKVVRFSPYFDQQKYEQIKKDIAALSVEELGTYSFKGINVGHYAINSSVRYFLSPHPLWEREDFVAKVKEYLVEACNIALCCDQLLSQRKYDKLFMSHGIYLTWGILFEIARNKGIDVDVYNGSYRKNTLRIYKNAPNAPFPIAEWERFKNVALSNDQNALLDKYIDSREDQSEDNIQLFKGDNDYPEVTQFIQKAKANNAKLACLYTNIAWDAYSFSSEAIFESMNDWLQATIEHVRTSIKEPFYLIVKAHPAERFCNVPHEFRVKQYIPKNLPDNVLFITEEMEVKPFALYEHIDFGIINISTVSIEMALRNIPVLTSGAGGHYSNHGFTIDPTSREEYFNQLQKLVDGSSGFKPDIEMARRYMFYRFFWEALPFDYLSSSGGVSIQPEAINDSKNYRSLTTISEGIVNNTPFVFDWTKTNT